jgi:amino acid adenylation domain-containing protein
LLAIIKSGRAFVVVNADNPETVNYERYKQLNVDKILITERPNELKVEKLKGIKCVNNDKIIEDLAYVCFTSGTTGASKGVMIGQPALSNFSTAINERLTFKKGEKILASSAFSFDISILETIVSLYYGLEILLLTDKERKNPKKIVEIVHTNKINILQMTPTMMQNIIAVRKKDTFNSVKQIILGGENLPVKLLDEVRSSLSAVVHNFYGPTECTIWCSSKIFKKSNDITLGKPLSGVTMKLVVNNALIEDSGVVGEIWVGGKQLSSGYLNDSDRTKDKFVRSTFDGKNYYKTGDLGIYNKKKEIKYIGRNDNQVKVNGYRIELEEVEHFLLRITKIKQAIVHKYTDVNDKHYLCAFIVASAAIKEKTIIIKLLEKLPMYKIPQKYVFLKQMPMTTNMKIDRNELLNQYNNLGNFPKNVGDNQESKLISIVREKSKYPTTKSISSETSLMELGYDSISTASLLIHLEEVYKIDLLDQEINYKKLETIGGLQDLIEEMLSK